MTRRITVLPVVLNFCDYLVLVLSLSEIDEGFPRSVSPKRYKSGKHVCTQNCKEIMIMCWC